MGITLRQIVTEAIKQAGADGLVNLDGECGCGIDDLWPCGHPNENCELARKVPVPTEYTQIRRTAPQYEDDTEQEWFVPLEEE